MKFCENITLERKKRGWTQETAGKNLGIKPVTLSAYEEGRAFPRPDTIRKIIEGYGVKKEDVYDFLFSIE